ncbi:MAG: putative DNA binding domain-containing protein [Candidatus Cloacimonadales bacterium]|nr:putative DNA binding domain-containing protein [Candidatus Cloacimonadales bacterium]
MDLRNLVDSLISEFGESEWVEFKKDYYDSQLIGEYISALSNSACLYFQPFGYLVYGIEDENYQIVGTKLKPAKMKGKGNESLEPWLRRLLNPRINFFIHEFLYDEKRIVLFQIDAAPDAPVKFQGISYIRIGEHKHKLSKHPTLEKKIWNMSTFKKDWSAQEAKGAGIFDLELDALIKAKIEYKKKQKNANFYHEIDSWDDLTFLNKTKLAIKDKLTFATIILLGKPESTHFINPAVARITWIIKDQNGKELDYHHFDPPFLLNVDRLFAKIRNLTIRELPDGTLFPIEIDQYDNWVMREALHNCIAHQDYRLQSRIVVIENPDDLLFVNAGVFLPGSIEQVLELDAPQPIYPNKLLTEAMVNLNMIDTIGSGIKRMFNIQKDRFMAMPEYEFSNENQVKVKLFGKILDEEYTKVLMKNSELTLFETILLDKVQKKQKISKEAHQLLKKKKLVEGRYPNIYVSSEIAGNTGKKVDYIHLRGFDNAYYEKLIIEFLNTYKQATRDEIESLLMPKLPDILDEKQKKIKINNLLSNQLGSLKNKINNVGSRRYSRWKLKNNRDLTNKS